MSHGRVCPIPWESLGISYLALKRTAGCCSPHCRFNQGEFAFCLFLTSKLTSLSVSCFLSQAKVLAGALPSSLLFMDIQAKSFIHMFTQATTIY